MDNSSINFEDSFADLTLNFNSHVYNSPRPADEGGGDNPTIGTESEDSSVVPTQPGPAPKRWLC